MNISYSAGGILLSFLLVISFSFNVHTRSIRSVSKFDKSVTVGSTVELECELTKTDADYLSWKKVEGVKKKFVFKNFIKL